MARLLALGLLAWCSLSSAASPRLLLEPEDLHPPTLIASGAFVALLSTPLVFLIGSGIGTSFNDLPASRNPTLVAALLAPSLAVAITQWMLAERSAPGRFRLIPALLLAVVAQAAVIAAGVFLGVDPTLSSGGALLTLGATIVLPTVTTATLKITERSAVASATLLSGSF